MVEQEVEIVNRMGLHARAAAKLVHVTGKYQCQVSLAMDGEKVDAKSILGILLLAAAQGSRIIVRCDGEDEEEALTAVATLISNRFEEDA